MKLRVQYMAQLRTALGISEEEIELPEGPSLLALLRHLAERHGENAACHLLTAGGAPQPGLLMVVNGTAQYPRQADAIVLRPHDTVMLMPPIAGG